jgi:hypothetical protein
MKLLPLLALFAWVSPVLAEDLPVLAIDASHTYLATAKTRSWIAVGGKTASIRALKISGKP